MNILITGGAGYLGSVLVPRLLARHDVTVLDNFIHGENTLSQCCADPGFDVVKGDARDMRIVEPLAKCGSQASGGTGQQQGLVRFDGH